MAAPLGSVACQALSGRWAAARTQDYRGRRGGGRQGRRPLGRVCPPVLLLVGSRRVGVGEQVKQRGGVSLRQGEQSAADQRGGDVGTRGTDHPVWPHPGGCPRPPLAVQDADDAERGAVVEHGLKAAIRCLVGGRDDHQGGTVGVLPGRGQPRPRDHLGFEAVQQCGQVRDDMQPLWRCGGGVLAQQPPHVRRRDEDLDGRGVGLVTIGELRDEQSAERGVRAGSDQAEAQGGGEVERERLAVVGRAYDPTPG